MNEINQYLENLKPEYRAELERIRGLVKQTVPNIEEVISYGMPVFKYEGKYLIGMSAFKEHLSVFPGSGPIEALSGQLTQFKTSKGTIQFTLEKPLPDELLVSIIQSCLAHTV